MKVGDGGGERRRNRLGAKEIWPVVHQERLALARDLEQMRPEEWTTPSLCPGWTVHDVFAHLVDDATTTRLGFVASLLAVRFDFDRLNERGVQWERRSDPMRTVARLRDVARRTTSAPVPIVTRLVEIFVHGEDIRRPLGIQHSYPEPFVLAALEYQIRTSTSMGGGKERVAGLRLVTTSGVELGAGEEVRGDSVDLLLAVSGRPVGLGRLEGPGAAELVVY